MKWLKCVIAPFMAVALASSAFAAEPKPDISISDKATDITVTIDPALKKHDGLYANLLAEGRRMAAKWRARADKERRENPDFFSGGRRWYLERNYHQRSAIGRYVSITRYDATYSGGAHPNSVIEAILWDMRAKKQISIRPFFRETADGGPTMQTLARRIRAALAKEKKSRDIPVGDPDTDSDLASVKPKLTQIGAVVLVPSTERGKSAGFVFYFSPYFVGSYVEGSYHVFIPWRDFRTNLSPTGIALFGGERAQGDAEND
jgi:hypothetical protein